jgi:dolichol-phosphate mannosyltransferase
MHSVTVLVPTFNEEENALPLVERLQFALQGLKADVLFIDDSPGSDTVDAVAAAANLFNSESFQVDSYQRTSETKWGGLAGAITDGLRMVKTPYAVVMDADLQHPPEAVPTMLSKLFEGYDLVIGSRYCSGGSSEGLSGPMRHFVSRSSTVVAKMLFPTKLSGVTDPMTGFYALDMQAIDADRLQPRGFKILLETLTSHNLRVAEVPIHFAERHSGASKATFDKGVDYLYQLARLRFMGTGIKAEDYVGRHRAEEKKNGLGSAAPQDA